MEALYNKFAVRDVELDHFLGRLSVAINFLKQPRTEYYRSTLYFKGSTPLWMTFNTNTDTFQYSQDNSAMGLYNNKCMKYDVVIVASGKGERAGGA